MALFATAKPQPTAGKATLIFTDNKGNTLAIDLFQIDDQPQVMENFLIAGVHLNSEDVKIDLSPLDSDRVAVCCESLAELIEALS